LSLGRDVRNVQSLRLSGGRIPPRETAKEMPMKFRALFPLACAVIATPSVADEAQTAFSTHAKFERKARLPAEAAELALFRKMIAKEMGADGYQGSLSDLEKKTGTVEVVIKSERASSEQGGSGSIAWTVRDALGAGASEGDSFTYHACSDHTDRIWMMTFEEHRWTIQSYSARAVKECFPS
jgi:hypothetical protein